MLSVKEAESIVLNLAQPLDSQRDVETVDLLAASGRILAAPVTGSPIFLIGIIQQWMGTRCGLLMLKIVAPKNQRYSK